MRHLLAFASSLLLVASSARADIRGYVLATSGKPVPGAKVVLHPFETPDVAMRRLTSSDPEPKVIATGAVSDDGSFTVKSPARLAILHVEAPGFAPSFQFVADDTDTGAVALTEAKMKSGSVTAGGKPVANARVVWIASAGDFSASLLEIGTAVTTDSKGQYSIVDPSTWAVGAHVFHPDYAPAFVSAREEAEAPMKAELTKGVLVHGVVKSRSGATVVGAEVWSGGVPVAKTDGKGAFDARVEQGSSEFTIRGAEYQGVGRSQEGQVTITVAEGRSVAGTVIDAKTSQPVGGAVVLAYPTFPLSAAVADAKGNFVLPGLQPGAFRMGAFFPGYDSAIGGAVAADLTESTSLRVTVPITRAQQIRGRIADAEGKAVGGAFVVPIPKDTPSFYIFDLRAAWGAYSAPDGSFRLAAMPVYRGADVELMVIRSGFAISRQSLAKRNLDEPVNVRLTTGVAIRGRVHSRDGKPIAGAEIAIAEMRSGYRPSMADFFEAQTGGTFPKSGPEGQFAVNLNPGEHEFAVRASGYAPVSLRSYQITPLSGVVDIVMDAGAVVSGTVVYSDGSPAANASLSLASPSRDSDDVKADAAGRFRFADLVSGKYQLFASDADEMLTQMQLVSAPSSNLRIVLPASGSISGRVFDGKTSAPVQSFTVTLTDPNDDDVPRQSSKTITDARGQFSLDRVPVGERVLTVTAAGFIPKKIEGVAIEAGQKVTHDVALDRGITIEGRVADTGGKPVVGAVVQTDSSDGYSDYVPVTTDEQGQFSISSVTPAARSMTVWKEGFVRTNVELKHDRTRYDVTLSRGLSISGTIMSAGGAVANAWVSATPSDGSPATSYGRAKSDQSGKFVAQGLEAGTYDISAGTEELRGEVKGVDAEHAQNVVVTLEKPPKGIITGRVLNVPAGDFTMRMVSATSATGSAQAMFDSNGTFRIEDAPVGDVTVIASVQSETERRSSDPEELEVAPDSEARVELRFSSAITIRGRITRGEDPVFGASVSFERLSSQGTNTVTDAEGRYEVAGLAPGKYTVSVSSPMSGSSFSVEYVARQSAELDLDIAGAEIKGVVVEAGNSQPLAGVEVTLWKSGGGESEKTATTDTRGRFAFKSVNEGQYRVLAQKEGFGQGVRELTLSNGTASELRIALSPSDGLRVRAVDARTGTKLRATVVARDPARRIVATGESNNEAEDTLLRVGAGSYLVSASADGYATSTVPAAAPGSVLTVPLTPGGTLVIDSDRMLQGVVRLIMPTGDEYVRCWCNGIPEIELKGRHTVIEHVAAGSYTMNVVDVVEESTRSFPVTVIEGGSVTVKVP